MSDLINFRSFSNEADAQAVADQLQNAGITTDVSKKARRGDAFLQIGDYVDDYVLRIAPADFENANKILFKEQGIDISTIDPAHPLLTLTTDELKDVIAKPDEWGSDNYVIATALLKDKGIAYTNEELKQLQNDRLSFLARRKKASNTLIITGYLLALFPLLLNGISGNSHLPNFFQNIRWYFPGLLSPSIAWSVLVARTTLPNGRRIATYDDTSIRHGIFIAAANIISWVICLAMMWLS